MNDGDYVTQNHRVQNPSWANTGRFLSEVTNPSTVRGYYQPLAMISLMLDSAMGGRPDYLRPYHRTSLALHVANTALVVVLMYLLFGEPWVAALIGLVFGTHPMTVETIAWLGERKTTLATFFGLGCLTLYVTYALGRRTSWKLYAACLVTFILALMSKPTVTPMPALVLLLDYWPLRRLDRRAILEKVPLLAIAGVFVVVTVISQGHMQLTDYQELSFAQTALIACHNVVFYPLKMIWPTPLSSVYPFPEPISLSHPMVLAGVIAIGLLVPALLVSLRWTRALLTGWLFFFVALSPTLMNVGYAFGVAADKYAYLPSIGLLLILAWGLHWFWSHPSLRPCPPVRETAALLLVVILAAAQARATHRYLAHWQDTGSFCRHILAIAPKTSWAHNLLGYDLLEHGRIEEAVEHCREAIRLDPDSAKAHINLGLALTEKRQLDEAVTHFEKALQLRPDSTEAHNNLGIVLAARGEFDKAAAHFEASLHSMPHSPEAHFNLGLALAARGKLDRAITHFKASLRLRPDSPEVHFNLGCALAAKRQFPGAILHFTKTLELKPDSPEAHFNLARALAVQDRVDEAITHLEKTLQFKPDSAEVHCKLGDLLRHRGRVEEASRAYRAALAIDPDHAMARSGLNAALASQPGATRPE